MIRDGQNLILVFPSKRGKPASFSASFCFFTAKQYQMAVSDLSMWMRTMYYDNVNVAIALAAGQAGVDR
jgi:hypothetical protein